MGLFRSIGARKDSTRGTAPIDVRKDFANLFTGPGVLPGADSPLVTGTAGWAYSVGRAGFVTTRGVSDGVHLFGNDGAVVIGATGVGSTVPAAPGTGLSRIDIAWVRHPAAGENGDTTSDPLFGVTSGTAAASPVAPAIPVGALELARNTMTSAATTTASTGNSITQTAAKTGMASTVDARTRVLAPALSGTFATVDLVANQTIPAGTFLAAKYELFVHASAQVIIAAGGGARLEVLVDDVVVRSTTFGAAGTQNTGIACTATVTLTSAAVHTCRARLVNVAGANTVSADTGQSFTMSLRPAIDF